MNTMWEGFLNGHEHTSTHSHALKFCRLSSVTVTFKNNVVYSDWKSDCCSSSTVKQREKPTQHNHDKIYISAHTSYRRADGILERDRIFRGQIYETNNNSLVTSIANARLHFRTGGVGDKKQNKTKTNTTNILRSCRWTMIFYYPFINYCLDVLQPGQRV